MRKQGFIHVLLGCCAILSTTMAHAAEVWTGNNGSNEPVVTRFDFNGNVIGEIISEGIGPHGSLAEIDVITVVGDEVWIGSGFGGQGHIQRYAFDGTYLGFHPFTAEIEAMAVVPEPVTGLLMGICGFVILNRR